MAPRPAPGRPRPVPRPSAGLLHPSPPAARLLLGLSLAAAVPACAQEPPTPSPVVGTWEYTYPYPSESLDEDHLMVIEEAGDGTLRGWYRGTSDDFDAPREGYLPGFFVAEMEALEVSGDSLRFRLAVPPDAYVTEPVPLGVLSVEETPPGTFEPWPNRAAASREPRSYVGLVDGDRIVLEVDGAERVFRRVGR